MTEPSLDEHGQRSRGMEYFGALHGAEELSWTGLGFGSTTVMSSGDLVSARAMGRGPWYSIWHSTDHGSDRF